MKLRGLNWIKVKVSGLKWILVKNGVFCIFASKKNYNLKWWAQLTLGENPMGFGANGIKAEVMGSFKPKWNGPQRKRLV